MFILIISALAASLDPSLPVRASDPLTADSGIPRDLFFLARRPNGTMFCDKTLQRQQKREFDKRYGDRFSKLAEVVRRREGLGWDSDEIVTTPCFRMSRRMARSLLDEFDHDLKAYEARYGLGEDVD